MKKLCLIALLVLIPSLASAHVLETDKNIGAVLHVDPNDDPVATKTANFFFDFQDRDKKFQMADCSCTVVVQQNGKELASQELTALTDISATTSYIFPAIGVYTIKLIGVPNTPGAFQPFDITYTVRVAQDANSQPMVPGWVWGLVALVLVAGLVAAGTYARQKTAKARAQRHQSTDKSQDHNSNND